MLYGVADNIIGSKTVANVREARDGLTVMPATPKVELDFVGGGSQ